MSENNNQPNAADFARFLESVGADAVIETGITPQQIADVMGALGKLACDKAWLKKQNAADVEALHLQLANCMLRLSEAVQPILTDHVRRAFQGQTNR